MHPQHLHAKAVRRVILRHRPRHVQPQLPPAEPAGLLPLHAGEAELGRADHPPVAGDVWEEVGRLRDVHRPLARGGVDGLDPVFHIGGKAVQRGDAEGGGGVVVGGRDEVGLLALVVGVHLRVLGWGKQGWGMRRKFVEGLINSSACLSMREHAYRGVGRKARLVDEEHRPSIRRRGDVLVAPLALEGLALVEHDHAHVGLVRREWVGGVVVHGDHQLVLGVAQHGVVATPPAFTRGLGGAVGALAVRGRPRAVLLANKPAELALGGRRGAAAPLASAAAALGRGRSRTAEQEQEAPRRGLEETH